MEPSRNLQPLDPVAAGVAGLLDQIEGVQCWIKDREGRYAWVNRGFLLNYALERTEQVVGRTDHDLSPPHLADQYRLDDDRALGGVEEQSVYLKLAEATQDDPAFAGKERYPHALRHAKDAPEAVAVLRRALAAAEDGSVVVVQVGFSTNLARLLDSPPDATSPLDGKALVAKKVKLLELMAGAFQPIDGNAAYEEYNVVKDRAAAAKLAEAWPTEMIWSGFEIGIALPYPSQSILEDFRDVPHHPVKESYAILSPPPQDRPSWDLTSVLDGVLGSRGYFDRSPPGKVTVTERGATTFAPDPQGKHRYLVLNDLAARARVIEALVQLSSQPR